MTLTELAAVADQRKPEPQRDQWGRPCSVMDCGEPKVSGSGNIYCERHKIEAAQRGQARDRAALERWHRDNPEALRAAKRAYYLRTAELQRKRASEWYYANKDRALANNRAKRQERKGEPRVRKYGLTVADYANLLAAQNGKCAICGRTENGKRINFDVDHDHVTGKIRGLLCNRCNRLLSNAVDSVEILRSAQDYLTGKA